MLDKHFNDIADFLERNIYSINVREKDLSISIKDFMLLDPE